MLLINTLPPALALSWDCSLISRWVKAESISLISQYAAPWNDSRNVQLTFKLLLSMCTSTARRLFAWPGAYRCQIWRKRYKVNYLIHSYNSYTVVSRKYAPPPLPFATLALVQSAAGAYTRDATFSSVITPSLPVPSIWVKHDHIVGGGVGAERRMWGREMHVPKARGRLTSFSIEGEGSKV